MFAVAMAVGALTIVAVAGGLMLTPEACGLGLAFGLALLYLQIEGVTVVRVAALLRGKDPAEIRWGARVRVLGYAVVAAACVGSSAAWFTADTVGPGLPFVAAALPFAVLLMAFPAAVWERGTPLDRPLPSMTERLARRLGASRRRRHRLVNGRAER